MMTNVAKVLEDLRGAIASMNARFAGTRLDVQPLPQPGRGCLARFLVQHNYANGINISRTEVAIAGQISARHPRFTWEKGSGGAGDQKDSGSGVEWDDLLMCIVDKDQQWIARWNAKRRR